MIKIKYNSWGGVRDESKVIKAIHDQWCTDHGYPIKKRVIKRGRRYDRAFNKDKVS